MATTPVNLNQFILEVVTLTRPDINCNQFILEITYLPVPPSIACASPPEGQQGEPYTHTFPAAGGLAPYTFTISAGSLPPGLTLNASTGVVSGVPTAGDVFPFTISVTDANLASSSVNCSITIASVFRLTMRGYKRTPDFGACVEAPQVGEIKQAPHVKTAV